MAKPPPSHPHENAPLSTYITTQERKAAAAGPSKESTSNAQMIDTSPPRGTRDFAPPDLRARDWLFDNFAAVSRSHGFERFETPVLESEALFTRKAGEEIAGQLYNFEDKGGRRVALRPELTPSLARLVLSQGKSLALPAKWFTIGQCWRYERTTRGRRREHYQWNMDIVGVEGVEVRNISFLPFCFSSVFSLFHFSSSFFCSPCFSLKKKKKKKKNQAEAELLAAVVAFFERVGLTSADVVLRVSSRRVLQSAMEAAGVQEEAFARACVAVDKLDKIPEEKVREELEECGVSGKAADSVLAATRVKSLDELEALLRRSEESGSGSGSSGGSEEASSSSSSSSLHPAVAELRRLWELADSYGIADWLELDTGVVRGLAYYTGIVFEGRDRKGELRAICGGGRYDELLSTLGAKGEAAAPCAGFGFGDCVIMELLKDRGLIPEEVSRHRVDDLVVALEPGLHAEAARLAAKLRRRGNSSSSDSSSSSSSSPSEERIVDLVLEQGRRMKWVFKHAERVGARKLYLMGKREWEAEGGPFVRVKDLETREEGDVKVEDV